MTRKSSHGQEFLSNAIETYYQYNPDTLMPLLMLALAAQGRLDMGGAVKEGYTVFASINIAEVLEYEWVRLNQPLRKRLKDAFAKGVEAIHAIGRIPEELGSIYEIFLKYDTVTVVQEYHHRKGILIHHSSNAASEASMRQYATLCLAEELLKTSGLDKKDIFLKRANDLLEKSGIQPKRPRIKVAEALCHLIGYDGEGIVYNPFAGCAFAGAMIGAGDRLIADGDSNEKILAVSKLLCYGTGQKGADVEERDSTEWLQNGCADYVISTFLGYPGGKSAFDLCLVHCLEDFKESGKFAGIAEPKDIFEKRSPEMTEALKRDWVDSIVLLPFAEVAILIDAAKSKERKGKVRFYNLNFPMYNSMPIREVLADEYANVLSTSDVKKKGTLKALIAPSLKKIEGYEFVRLGDLVDRIPRRVYDMGKINVLDRNLAYIDRSEPYKMDEPFVSDRRTISQIIAPAYKLYDKTLIVNAAGRPEPRFLDPVYGGVFFQDGIAFALHGGYESSWLITELNETYVLHQLHPYGINPMVPETRTEKDYLNLKIRREIEGYWETKQKQEEEDRKREEKEDAINNALPKDFVISNGNNEYRILSFISNGSFGYTYKAERQDKGTGEKEIVAIKEFFPREIFHKNCCHRNGKVDYPARYAERFKTYKNLFQSEPDFILSMKGIANNRVTEVKEQFYSNEIGTHFYVMKYYAGVTLKDMIESGRVPASETIILDKIVRPLCLALKAMHSKKILHLDIKPENVVIDENGEAVLIDFGVAHLYGKGGKLESRRDAPSCSPYSAPENKDGNMRHFDPQADIFGVAGTLYSLMSRSEDVPVINEEFDEEVFGTELKCSEQMKTAIMQGLYRFPTDRPANALAFYRNFPGCKSKKL